MTLQVTTIVKRPSTVLAVTRTGCRSFDASWTLDGVAAVGGVNLRSIVVQVTADYAAEAVPTGRYPLKTAYQQTTSLKRQTTFVTDGVTTGGRHISTNVSGLFPPTFKAAGAVSYTFRVWGYAAVGSGLVSNSVAIRDAAEPCVAEVAELPHICVVTTIVKRPSTVLAVTRTGCRSFDASWTLDGVAAVGGVNLRSIVVQVTADYAAEAVPTGRYPLKTAYQQTTSLKRQTTFVTDGVTTWGRHISTNVSGLFPPTFKAAGAVSYTFRVWGYAAVGSGLVSNSVAIRDAAEPCVAEVAPTATPSPKPTAVGNPAPTPTSTPKPAGPVPTYTPSCSLTPSPTPSSTPSPSATPLPANHLFVTKNPSVTGTKPSKRDGQVR
eukprot:tig00021572_g22413.t1